jgi:hypothetical protein
MDITRLPPSEKTIHVKAQIPISQRDEFDGAMTEIVAGERPRMDAPDREETGRLHQRAYIADPVGKAKSVLLTEEGLRESERLFNSRSVANVRAERPSVRANCGCRSPAYAPGTHSQPLSKLFRTRRGPLILLSIRASGIRVAEDLSAPTDRSDRPLDIDASSTAVSQ